MVVLRISLSLVLLLSVSGQAYAQYCSQEITLVPGQLASAAFGASVALTADAAVVGDPYDDPAAVPAPGFVSTYVRHPAGGHLLFEAHLTSSDGTIGDRFGIDCDFDGATMVVGADGHDQEGLDAGAAYVFERVLDQWVETQKIVSPIAAPGDAFGATVAVMGEWMLISAPGGEDVFVYRDSGSAWTMYQVLPLPNAQTAGSVEAEIAHGRIAIANDNLCRGFEFSNATQRWEPSFNAATAASFHFTGMAFDGDRLVLSRNYGLIEVYERNTSTGNWGIPRPISVTAPGAVALTVDRVLVMEPAAGRVRTFVQNGSQWVSSTYAPGGLEGPSAIATDGLSALVSGPVTPVLYDFECGAIGSPHCQQSAVNSTGSVGGLQAIGSDLLANNQLELLASVLPDHAFGYFLCSRTPGLVIGPGSSAGDLCLGGAIGRYVGPGEIQNTGSAGGFRLALDLNAMPSPTGPVNASVGETWYFQAWHRDANPLPGSNLTNSVSVMIR